MSSGSDPEVAGLVQDDEGLGAERPVGFRGAAAGEGFREPNSTKDEQFCIAGSQFCLQFGTWAFWMYREVGRPASVDASAWCIPLIIIPLIIPLSVSAPACRILSYRRPV